MTAGFRPTVQSGDNGEYDTAVWKQMLEEVFANAVPTGDIGILNGPGTPGGTASRPHPGTSGPGKR